MRNISHRVPEFEESVSHKAIWALQSLLYFQVVDFNYYDILKMEKYVYIFKTKLISYKKNFVRHYFNIVRSSTRYDYLYIDYKELSMCL